MFPGKLICSIASIGNLGQAVKNICLNISTSHLQGRDTIEVLVPLERATTIWKRCFVLCSLAVTNTKSLSYLRSISLDHLWVASLIAIIWLFISVTPLPPNDLWWHMAAGRTMVDERAWLVTNRWAYTLPADAPYVYQSWFSEVILYGLWKLGNVPLLTLARTLAITLSYGLLAWHAWRRTQGQGKAVTASLFLAVLIGWNNWTLRPQTLALLPGAIFVVVLSEYIDRRISVRWLVLLPLLMVVWVNTHGSFVLGLGLLVLGWVGMLLSNAHQLRTRDMSVPSKTQERSVSVSSVCPQSLQSYTWQELRWLTYTTLATGLACLAHPIGLGMPGYVRSMITNPSLQRWFVEWQAPTNDANLLGTGFWFYVMLLLLAVLMAAAPRRPTATDLLWYCALAWLTIGGERYAMWFGLLLFPLLATQLASIFPPGRRVRTSPAFAVLYGGVLGLMMFAVLPWFTPTRYLGPGALHLFARSGPYNLLLSNTTPLAATEWLANNPQPGRFWTDMSYTSYTIWRLPEKQVFTDLRVELFPESIWEQYFAISRGDTHSLELLDTWQITHVMLDRVYLGQLEKLLNATPGWCQTYHDQRTTIMVRCP